MPPHFRPRSKHGDKVLVSIIYKTNVQMMRKKKISSRKRIGNVLAWEVVSWKHVSGFEHRTLRAQRLVGSSSGRNKTNARVSAADKPLHQITPSPEGNGEGKIGIHKGWLCVPHHFRPQLCSTTRGPPILIPSDRGSRPWCLHAPFRTSSAPIAWLLRYRM